MKTTTVKITHQEFDTILTALHIFKDDGELQTCKENMIIWYQQNEPHELLNDQAIAQLIQKLCTSKAAPSCIMCGFDATCAFTTPSNSYCDECKENRKDYRQIQAKPPAPPPTCYTHDRRKNMKLHSTLTPEQAKFTFQTVLQVPEGEINFDEVSRVEVHGTDLDDPGEDYCEYRVFDLHGHLVKIKREMGY